MIYKKKKPLLFYDLVTPDDIYIETMARPVYFTSSLFDLFLLLKYYFRISRIYKIYNIFK